MDDLGRSVSNHLSFERYIDDATDVPHALITTAFTGADGRGIKVLVTGPRRGGEPDDYSVRSNGPVLGRLHAPGDYGSMAGRVVVVKALLGKDAEFFVGFNDEIRSLPMGREDVPAAILRLVGILQRLDGAIALQRDEGY
ncbi:MAG: hypothetical protein ACTSXZ_10190 [Alphaproteobacteria bacterium]